MSETNPYTISSELEDKIRTDEADIMIFDFIKGEVNNICQMLYDSRLFPIHHKEYVNLCLYKIFQFCCDNLYELKRNTVNLQIVENNEPNYCYSQNILNKTDYLKKFSKLKDLFTNEYIEEKKILFDENINLIDILNEGGFTKYSNALYKLSDTNAPKRNWRCYCNLMEIMRDEILHRDPYEYNLDQLELLMYCITLIISFCIYHKLSSDDLEKYDVKTQLKSPSFDNKNSNRTLELRYYYYCFNIFWTMFRNDKNISNIEKKQMKKLLEETLIFV